MDRLFLAFALAMGPTAAHATTVQGCVTLPCPTEYACKSCFTASYDCLGCQEPCDWSFTIGHEDGSPPFMDDGTGWSGSKAFVLRADCGQTAEATFMADGGSGKLTLVCAGGC